MKPVKPKKLPRWLESDMKTYADRKRDLVLTPDCINLVLAALEYERQRADGKLAVDAPLRCACGHLQRNHFKAGEFACKVANCGCPRFVCV